MDRKDGQYYYAPYRRRWGIFQHHDEGNGFSSGTFIKECPTKEEARKEVYKLNNWIIKDNANEQQ